MKKLSKALICAVTLCALICTMGASTTEANAKAPGVKKVVLTINGRNVTKKTCTIKKGSVVKLQVKATPKKARKSVAYKSKKKKIASVSKKGIVTAKKAGITKLTVRVKGKNGKKKTTWVKIKVVNPQPEHPSENRKPEAPNPSEPTNPAPTTPTNPVPTEPVAPTLPGRVTSGTLGTCVWNLDKEGTLTLSPSNGNSQGSFTQTVSDESVPAWPWSDLQREIKKVKVEGNIIANGSLNSMFFGCGALTAIDASGLDTSNVTNMRNMLAHCYALKQPGIAGWDTRKVTDMTNMFYGCSALTQLDIGKWNTGSVVNMDAMFYGCLRLKELNIRGWNTGNAVSMGNMFNGCIALSLDCSAWNVSKVENHKDFSSDSYAITEPKWI